MRRFLYSVLMLLTGTIIAIPCFAGESKIPKKDIPEKVLQAFQKAYSGVRIQDQAIEINGAQRLYVLEYSINKIEHDAVFKADGAIAGNNVHLEVTALPEVIVTAFKTEFPKATIKEAEEMTRAGVVTYGLILKNGEDEINTVYAANGKLLNKDVMKEKEESGEDTNEKGEKEDGGKDKDDDK